MYLDINQLRADIRLNETQRVGNDITHFTSPRTARSFLAEVQHPLRHFFDAAGSAIDDVEIHAEWMVVWKSLIDEAQVSSHQRQRIVHFMGEASRKFTDRDEPREMQELFRTKSPSRSRTLLNGCTSQDARAGGSVRHEFLE